MSPVGDTGTLTTALRANAPPYDASTIESTPNSPGVAVISEHICVLGVKVKKTPPMDST
ncbi:hypothetical protein EDD22DRAFT_951838 [Suillus occidentalis]|nr:hypothetical protein EDD22DRAFT_951838 [Suillus occidentalis]